MRTLTVDSLIIFIRHGEAEIPEDYYPDHYTMGLSSLGVAQANAVADALSAIEINWIVTSPFKRAAVTAAAIARYHASQVEFAEQLEERVFKPLTLMTFEDIANRYGQDLCDSVLNGNTDHISLTTADTIERYSQRVYEYIGQIGANRQGTTLLVSHGGPHDWYLQRVITESSTLRRVFSIGKCRISLFTFQSGQLVIQALNCCTHICSKIQCH